MNDRKVSALVLSRVLKGKQLHGYFLVGSIAAVIDFTVLFAAVRAGVYYLIANTIAFMSANIFNFLAGHYFVFNKRSRMTNLFHTYAAVLFISIVGLLINNGTLFVAVDLIATDLFAGKVLQPL